MNDHTNKCKTCFGDPNLCSCPTISPTPEERSIEEMDDRSHHDPWKGGLDGSDQRVIEEAKAKLGKVDKIVEELFEDTIGMTDYVEQLETTDDADKFVDAVKQTFRTTLTTDRAALIAAVEDFVNKRMGGDIAATAQFPDSPEHRYAYVYLVQNRRELMEFLATLTSKHDEYEQKQ